MRWKFCLIWERRNVLEEMSWLLLLFVFWKHGEEVAEAWAWIVREIRTEIVIWGGLLFLDLGFLIFILLIAIGLNLFRPIRFSYAYTSHWQIWHPWFKRLPPFWIPYFSFGPVTCFIGQTRALILYSPSFAFVINCFQLYFILVVNLLLIASNYINKTCLYFKFRFLFSY